jgi:PKD domain
MLLAALLSATMINAQKYDYNWLLKSRDLNNKSLLLNFSIFPPDKQIINDFKLNNVGSTISDSLGNRIGVTTINKFHAFRPSIVTNNDSMVFGLQFGTDVPCFSNATTLWLKHPLSKDIANIYFGDFDEKNWTVFDYAYDQIIECKISKTAGDTLVVSQKRVIIEDSIKAVLLQAVKHANGQDYWLYACSTWYGTPYSSPVLYMHRYLIDKSGIHEEGVQKFEGDFGPRIWQFVGSPDGSMLASCSSNANPDLTNPAKTEILIFDVDRCTGLVALKQQSQVNFEYWNHKGLYGIAFSPNSRFLYYSSTVRIYQQDLFSLPAIEIDTVVKLSYNPSLPTTWNLNGYNYMRLGPDGRIYVSQYDALGIIEKPNVKGVGCMFKPKAIKINTSEQSYPRLPHFPEYRLGAIDGSVCDTLGLDNCVLGNFHWVMDSTNLSVDFIDNSTYQPVQWQWDFGDGSAVVSDTNPIHTFPAPGIYDVCMVVTNSCRSDTLCQKVEVFGTSSQIPIVKSASIWKVFPNPTSTEVTYQFDDTAPIGFITLSDMCGKKLELIEVFGQYGTIALDAYAAGVYLLSYTNETGMVVTEKIGLIK